MPSSRFVLPSPFGPTATISPSGMGSSLVSAWLRKSRSSTHDRRMAHGEAIGAARARTPPRAAARA